MSHTEKLQVGLPTQIVEDFDVLHLFLGNFSCQISHLQVLRQNRRKAVFFKIFTIISHK